jgi:hypothetical protein
MTFHGCFLPSFDSFGKAVSERRFFRNQLIRNKNCLWRPCLLTDRDEMSNLDRGSFKNQRLPGACNRSPGSKLLSITKQLHCGGHLGGRAQLPETILEEDHPMTIPSKFGFN